MDACYTTAGISVYECVNNFPRCRLKVHYCCGRQRELVTPVYANIGESLRYEMKKKEGDGMVRESLSTFCLKLGTGRKRCRLGLGGSRTIRCSGSLPCPLQPSRQDSWLWRGIGRC